MTKILHISWGVTIKAIMVIKINKLADLNMVFIGKFWYCTGIIWNKKLNLS